MRHNFMRKLVLETEENKVNCLTSERKRRPRNASRCYGVVDVVLPPQMLQRTLAHTVEKKIVVKESVGEESF